MGLKLCIFSLPNTTFSYARGHCPLATPAREPALWNPGKHALASFVPYQNLPKAMIQTMLGINIVYNKIRTFFWWFILNVFWLIFKHFRKIWTKKSWDLGKILRSYIFSQNTVRSNIYFFSSPVLIFAPESIHQMAWFPFKNKTKQKQNKKQKTKQKKTKKKIRLLKGGGAHSP